MMYTFLWDGRTVGQETPKRRPVASSVLELPVENGGLALVNIDRELELIAAKRAFRWGTQASGKNQLLAEMVLRHPGVTLRSALDNRLYLTPRVGKRADRAYENKL